MSSLVLRRKRRGVPIGLHSHFGHSIGGGKSVYTEVVSTKVFWTFYFGDFSWARYTSEHLQITTKGVECNFQLCSSLPRIHKSDLFRQLLLKRTAQSIFTRRYLSGAHRWHPPKTGKWARRSLVSGKWQEQALSSLFCASRKVALLGFATEHHEKKKKKMLNCQQISFNVCLAGFLGWEEVWHL